MSENVKPEPIPLGMAYMTDTEVVIVGHPLMDDENHNCDMMGCSSVSHVLARVPRPPEHIHAEMDSLRKELEEKERALTAANERAEKAAKRSQYWKDCNDAASTEIDTLRSSLEKAEGLLKECEEYARKTSFCQEDDGWKLRAKESIDLASRIHKFTQGE